MIDWRWCKLEEMPGAQVYALLQARSAVFIVEQNCAYQDLDGADLQADHLIAWRVDGGNQGPAVAACLRVLAPGVKFAEPSIGRVLTTPAFRSTGLGRELVARGVEGCEQRYPGWNIRIGAQAHLERFYGSFGFVKASDVYLEDGIPHIHMVRRAFSAPATTARTT